MNNLKGIWSVSSIIELYKQFFPDNYKSYKKLIHLLIKQEISTLRKKLIDDSYVIPQQETFIKEINNKLAEIVNGKIKKIVNATGIIINTNFGRAPISSDILNQISEINKNYFNLEYNLNSSSRNSRQSHLDYLLNLLTGAESAFVVNNTAAALFLICNTFSKNKEIVVSRGELIEIGDSFRLPDIIESSQAILKEIGSTNKTYISDYIKGINGNTAILLKTHTSNYKIVGFTENVSSKEIALIAKENNLISFEDIGSGYLFDLNITELKKEPNAKDKISDGIDLVCFSGDKLLGSIQSGIIVGKKALIDQLKINPLARIIRIDKVSLTILENTLRTYLMEEEMIKESIPILKMISLSYQNILDRTEKLKSIVKSSLPDMTICIIDDFSQIGGGSLPEENIPTPVLSISTKNLNQISNKLKKLEPAIVVIIKNNCLLINLRTVFEEHDSYIADSITNLLKS